VWASALAGLTGAWVVCAVVAARRGAVAAVGVRPRWQDAMTTPTIVMAGV
jgi:hypothetical protein